MSRMIPLRRSDRRVEKSPFLAAISASRRSSSCSSETVPFVTGGRLLPPALAERVLPDGEGCEVARPVVVAFLAAGVGLRDFERACGTCLPLLDLGTTSPIGGAERYDDPGDGATVLGNGVHSALS